ncbi:MAG: hypothetical protein ACOYK7_06725 [Pirellulales bacterium]
MRVNCIRWLAMLLAVAGGAGTSVVTRAATGDARTIVREVVDDWMTPTVAPTPRDAFAQSGTGPRDEQARDRAAADQPRRDRDAPTDRPKRAATPPRAAIRQRRAAAPRESAVPREVVRKATTPRRIGATERWPVVVLSGPWDRLPCRTTRIRK